MARNMRAIPEVCDDDFASKLVVITGGTSGIGYQTARKYASCGAKLLLINRNENKSVAVCDKLRAEFGVDCTYLLGDLSRLDHMHRIGQALSELNDPIAVLIHNAGSYLSRRTATMDGLEMNFALHHLAPLVINHLVLDKLTSQESSRILVNSSEGYRFAIWGVRTDDLNWEKRRYTGLGAYGAAKMSQLLTMMIFAESVRGTGVTVNAMHPGVVRTNTGHENGKLYRRFKEYFIDPISQTPQVAAEALYFLGVSTSIEGKSGCFFHLTREEEVAPPARDLDVAERLWEISHAMGKLG